MFAIMGFGQTYEKWSSSKKSSQQCSSGRLWSFVSVWHILWHFGWWLISCESSNLLQILDDWTIRSLRIPKCIIHLSIWSTTPCAPPLWYYQFRPKNKMHLLLHTVSGIAWRQGGMYIPHVMSSSSLTMRNEFWKRFKCPWSNCLDSLAGLSLDPCSHVILCRLFVDEWRKSSKLMFMIVCNPVIFKTDVSCCISSMCLGALSPMLSFQSPRLYQWSLMVSSDVHRFWGPLHSANTVISWSLQLRMS